MMSFSRRFSFFFADVDAMLMAFACFRHCYDDFSFFFFSRHY